MDRRENKLDKSMSLHEIKDKIQLRFARQQADFIADNLDELIANTWSAAPVHKSAHAYVLNRPERRSLTSNAATLERHWEEAIFRKWEKNERGLDSGIPFRSVVSYQVMLRDTNKDCGWGEIDLLGATADHLPVVIELKSQPNEYLLRAVVEVLAYGIALRKAWNDHACVLRSNWEHAVGKSGSLDELSLAVIAPESYWRVVLSDSAKRIRFQTPQPVRQSIRTLLARMNCAKYPLTLIEIHAEPMEDENGLPGILDAIGRVMS